MKRIMTRILLPTCLLLLAGSMAHAAQPLTDLDELNRRLQETAGKITSIESEFVQTKHIDIFDEDVESRGTFLYCNGTQICLDYRHPISYRIVINGNRLMTLADGHKTIVNLGSNAMMNEMQKLIGACMAGNLQALQIDFDLTYEADAQHYYIIARPHDKNIAAYLAKIGLTIDKKDMSVTELVFHENENDYTRYRFTSKHFNQLDAHDPRFSIQ